MTKIIHEQHNLCKIMSVFLAFLFLLCGCGLKNPESVSESSVTALTEELTEDEAVDLLYHALGNDKLCFMVTGFEEYMNEEAFSIRAYYDEGDYITTEGFYLVTRNSNEIYKQDIIGKGYVNIQQEDILGLESGITDDETSYYTITEKDELYYYTIFDKYGNIAGEGGHYPREPHISLLDKYVRISYQAGTGASTRWSYYYDTENDSFSEVFYSVFDKYGDKIVYRNKDRIIIDSIFDDTSCHKEITDFAYPLSTVAEPFRDAEFEENGSVLRVTYLSGENYEEVTERFDLTK